MGKLPVTEIDLAWAAGFLDARGHVDSLQLSITHPTRAPLLRFTRIVGTGKVYGPYKIGYMWKIGSRKSCQLVAEKLWQYVATARRQRQLQNFLKETI